MDMLCLMHEGEPYGHLATVGGALTNEQVARMTGISVGRLRKLLHELESAGVSSRTMSGLLYSRRMVKDERIREVRAQSGKMGGNPLLLVKPEVDEKVKQIPTPAVAVASASASKGVIDPGLGDAQTVWEAHVGLVNRVKFGTAVGPVLAKYGTDVTLKALKFYVTGGPDKPSFRSPERFAGQAAHCVDMTRPLTPDELAREVAR